MRNVVGLLLVASVCLLAFVADAAPAAKAAPPPPAAKAAPPPPAAKAAPPPPAAKAGPPPKAPAKAGPPPKAPAKAPAKAVPPPKGAPPPKSAPSSAVAAPPAPPPPPSISAIRTAQFCPTSGRVDPLGPFGMKVNLGGMRGVVAGDASAKAELAFTYGGPSSATSPLADGTIRRQIGLRLRAQDTCNAIYVMWQIAPQSRVAVSVKRNPGKSTHAQCLDQGYINLRPTGEPAPPPPQVGAARVLRAEIEGRILRVTADGTTAWQGTLPVEADALTGPAGIRSDNGMFDFELRVPGGTQSAASCAGVIRD